MPLPYSYRYHTEVKAQNIHNLFPKALIRIFKHQGDDIVAIKPGQLRLKTKKNLLGQSYDCDIWLVKQKQENDIVIEIHLEPLLTMTTIVFMVSALFLFLSIKAFLIYGSIITAGFYVANLLFIMSYLKQATDQFTGKQANTEIEQSRLLEKQKQWQKQKYKCFACGADLTDFDLYCPDCGILLKKGRHEIPTSITKYENMTIRYLYTNQKVKGKQS